MRKSTLNFTARAATGPSVERLPDTGDATSIRWRQRRELHVHGLKASQQKSHRKLPSIDFAVQLARGLVNPQFLQFPGQRLVSHAAHLHRVDQGAACCFLPNLPHLRHAQDGGGSCVVRRDVARCHVLGAMSLRGVFCQIQSYTTESSKSVANKPIRQPCNIFSTWMHTKTSATELWSSRVSCFHTSQHIAGITPQGACRPSNRMKASGDMPRGSLGAYPHLRVVEPRGIYLASPRNGAPVQGE